MKAGKLSRSTTSPFLESEGSPMESIANIVDVMLVFACGLLLALVTVWNVDIGLDRPDNMYEVSDVVNESQNVQKENLQEAGKVYRDPATGNLYFIEE
ncbi:MAG: DUF2149 domain-containing protein [Acutalibacteraceae bacterium]|nr:DUF2149 domain-containing protein [Acutalibacteraceae bacterium]